MICYFWSIIALCEEYRCISSGSWKTGMVQVLSELMLRDQHQTLTADWSNCHWQVFYKSIFLREHCVTPLICFVTFASGKFVWFFGNFTEFKVYSQPSGLLSVEPASRACVHLAELGQNGISEDWKLILMSSLCLNHICNYFSCVYWRANSRFPVLRGNFWGNHIQRVYRSTDSVSMVWLKACLLSEACPGKEDISEWKVLFFWNSKNPFLARVEDRFNFWSLSSWKLISLLSYSVSFDHRIKEKEFALFIPH